MEITILNWEKFNERKDVKNPSWFRLQHNLCTHWQFYDFSHSEICAWLYILCEASIRNQRGRVTVNFEHAHRTFRLDATTVKSAIQKLKQNQVIEVRTVRGRYASGQNPGATIQDITEQDITGQNKGEPERAFALPPLVEVWNQYADMKLPRVKRMHPSGVRFRTCSARWREKPDRLYWRGVIEKINALPFCLGANKRGWKADIEFLCRPDTADNVLEGKYADANSVDDAYWKQVMGVTDDSTGIPKANGAAN